jgi:hypothetical protein
MHQLLTGLIVLCYVSLVVCDRVEDEFVEVDGLLTGMAMTVPALEHGLQEQHGLFECQAGRRAFGRILSSVRKPCAAVTSAVW